MKFLNWGKEKIRRAAGHIFRRTTDVAPAMTIPASAPIVHNEPMAPAVTHRIKIKKGGGAVRLPRGVATGDYVLFLCGKQHLQRGGTVVEVRGLRAKIRMICKAGHRYAYRKIAAA